MKVWGQEENGEMSLKYDTGKFTKLVDDGEVNFVDDLDDLGKVFEKKTSSEWIRDLIEKAWPDNNVFWIRSYTRSSALCSNPSAEDWQCGSFGPKNRTCKRLADHRGKCSDLFTLEDKKTITKRLDCLKIEEFDAILGKKPRNQTSKVFSKQKLKDILRDEG